MIYFIHRGFQGFTHKAITTSHAAPACRICSYRKLLRRNQYPRGTYIFMDRERMDQWELRVYSQLYDHLKNAGDGYRVLNNPARILNRYELLRTLYLEGINDFNAYLVAERQKPERYPVFIRRIFDHKAPLTDLLHDEKELEAALAGLRAKNEPGEGLVIIEYCAEPVLDNFFRKLSSYRIGEKLFFFQTVHEESWLVKYGTINSATNGLYEDEYEMTKNNAYEKELRRVFDIANVEYGRVDFGLVKGKIQIYEINTNPNIRPPGKHPNPVRTKSLTLAWEEYTDALHAIELPEATAPEVGKFRHPDIIHGILRQFWYGGFIRRR